MEGEGGEGRKKDGRRDGKPSLVSLCYQTHKEYCNKHPRRYFGMRSAYVTIWAVCTYTCICMI